ncbi:hypothetical protein LF1_13300 [Rubripirellula obstinata]|uniref:NfeD-like C-terminal domain-containing protein n=1 Tax=Rubripirellula obstinata TaxID=406547 RepID=A0A5B1CDZ8_9BACT|nr:NfeD family protein [Rubripirellula obstinata]KAA1258806.1 hypothetical protein LF1_13300 [Rubripirellula obstinata]
MTIAILLLVAFYLFLTAEFFLPTGGLMGVAAAAAVISSIVIAFSHSFAFGLTMLFVTLISTPILLTSLVRVWPHTPIGRRMLNRRPGQIDDRGPARRTRGGVAIEDLVGHRGIAKTNLLPSGLVVIDGQKTDAVSIGMPIDAGSTVKVTGVEGGRVHVRLISDEELAAEVARESSVRSPAALEESLEDL